MKKISIIGFGRFGKTLYRLIQNDFEITIFSRREIAQTEIGEHTRIAKDLKIVYENDVIFFAVPISFFEEVIKEHKQYFADKHLLIDVLSVKMHPAQVFATHLKDTKVQALLTHPMFGPDSSKNGFADLPMIMHQFKADNENYRFWKEYFTKKQLKVIEMTPQEHDKVAADSQGLTHFIGRLLEEYGLKESTIDSLGTKKLREIEEQTCNDTWQLFTDLQHFNPYTKQMRIHLGDVYDKLYNKLLPKQLDPDKITFGIQGGKGSFNEEALLYYVKQAKIDSYKVEYLYTSENVLAALHKGEIDRGIFAIHNSVGGIVGESIHAMAKYKFVILDEFAIKISHTLMIRPDADFSEVTTIMSHPQVFAQCKETLAQKYPHLQQVSGEGELIDHAMVAKELSEKKLPKHIAVMGSEVLASIYGLTVIEKNLQDAKQNYTSFLQVARG